VVPVDFDYTAIETTVWAAGGLVSNIVDVHQFFTALSRGQVISQARFSEMITGAGIESRRGPPVRLWAWCRTLRRSSRRLRGTRQPSRLHHSGHALTGDARDLHVCQYQRPIPQRLLDTERRLRTDQRLTRASGHIGPITSPDRQTPSGNWQTTEQPSRATVRTFDWVRPERSKGRVGWDHVTAGDRR
jgi:hypothetical protein